ncbi:MJ1477/TM1410 family putative glycoside hydrolase [Deinococcus sp.]|uniref:MJ1477/TM1410 family putative glycoside hydrolase n=1 Tax=Deinococcus sp. TaxID=47478 RepID=UPI0025C25D7D|nr:MJ1477/TM1410 family putative glycoside hydrolase [Deinococcus sp.]
MNPLALACLPLLMLAACSQTPRKAADRPASGNSAAVPVPPTPVPRPPVPARPALGSVKRWAVQLTGYSAARLGAVVTSPFELVVVDPFDDSGQPWTSREVSTAAQGRWLVAYLSMGAAESYRPYWQQDWKVGPPGWLLRADPDWPGNYDVAYWDPGWQSIALAQLDQVMAQGFSGVYMDLIDGYQRNPGRPTARADMVNWVCKVAAHARAKNPNFVIIPQNASELIRDPGYAACADASGNEETFVYATNQPTEPERQTELLSNYRLWQKAAKPVLTIEYADQPELMKSVAARARSAGLVPYLAERNLDRLIVPQP